MGDETIHIVRVQRPASASGPWYLHDERTGHSGFIEPAPEFEATMIDNVAYCQAESTADGSWRLLKSVPPPID